MARDIDLSKPLSDEDIAWLRSRYPLGYVEHMVALSNAPQGAEEDDQVASPTTDTEVLETPGEDVEEADEDLIGDTGEEFDPSKHTADEVLTYLGSLTDSDFDEWERQRVLEAERSGKSRKTVLGS